MHWRDLTFFVTLALLLWHAVLPVNAKRLPSAANFLHTQCDGHRRIYQSLINTQLAAYRDGVSVNHVLQLEGLGDPVALVYNNTVMTREIPAINMAAYWIPLLKDLAKKVTLPDLVLAGNVRSRVLPVFVAPSFLNSVQSNHLQVWDYPEDDTTRDGGPWFGYCNIVFMTSNLMLPAGEGVVSHLRCGRNCQPFTPNDHRSSRAIFLGSSTGWLVGRRRGVVKAGLLHNESLFAGYTQMIDLPEGGLPEGDADLGNLKPHMNLTEQVKQYKYIINADGHCAALRMRQLLASDSAVFWVETNQIEWFYPLLQPYVHYIPVRYLEYEPEDPLRDVVSKIAWAEQHPEKIQAIVRNANRFAVTHLSDHALTCYSLQMLEEYAQTFNDPQSLQGVAAAGNFSAAFVDY